MMKQFVFTTTESYDISQLSD